MISLLAAGGPSTGKQLVARGASNHAVYIVLRALEDEGFVHRDASEPNGDTIEDFERRGNRPRYLYELTEKGRAAARALKGTPQ